MSHKYDVLYTDTMAGKPNYAWARSATISVPDWSHFKGFCCNGRVEPKGYQREVMRRAKAAVGLTGVQGRTYANGDEYMFTPYKSCTVLFVSFVEVEPAK